MGSLLVRIEVVWHAGCCGMRIPSLAMECHFHHPTTQVGTYRRRIGLFTLLVLSLLHTTGSYHRLGLLSEPLTILSGLCGLRYS